MSKIKNDGLDQYGARSFKQQQFETAGIEGVNITSSSTNSGLSALTVWRFYDIGPFGSVLYRVAQMLWAGSAPYIIHKIHEFSWILKISQNYLISLNFKCAGTEFSIYAPHQSTKLSMSTQGTKWVAILVSIASIFLSESFIIALVSHTQSKRLVFNTGSLLCMLSDLVFHNFSSAINIASAFAILTEIPLWHVIVYTTSNTN